MRFLFIALCVPALVLAQPKKFRKFRINLATRITSNTLVRGAIFWPESGMVLGPSFTFFETISLRGLSLVWNPLGRRNKHQIKLGTRLINDNGPFIKFTDHGTDYRNQRDNALEAYTQYRFSWGKRKKSYIEFTASQELISYHGSLVDAELGYPVFPYTSAMLRAGVGSKKANQYYYGPTGESSWGFGEIGLSFT